jgi:hypothetical protein
MRSDVHGEDVGEADAPRGRPATMSAIAGWYPDPAGSGALRRWDGTAWTADVSPLPQSLVPAQGPQVAAGWYDDPSGMPDVLRWWDGFTWTGHIQQSTPSPEPVLTSVGAATATGPIAADVDDVESDGRHGPDEPPPAAASHHVSAVTATGMTKLTPRRRAARYRRTNSGIGEPVAAALLEPPSADATQPEPVPSVPSSPGPTASATVAQAVAMETTVVEPSIEMPVEIPVETAIVAEPLEPRTEVVEPAAERTVVAQPAPEATDDTQSEPDPGLPPLYYALRGTGDVDVDVAYREELGEVLDSAADPGALVAVLVPEHGSRRVAVDLLVAGERHHAGWLSDQIAGDYFDALEPRSRRGEYGTVSARAWRGSALVRLYLRLGAPDDVLPPTLPVPNGVFLDGSWSAFVSSPAVFQERLRAAVAEGPPTRLFSLSIGVNSDSDTIVVRLDGQQIGSLPRVISARYIAEVRVVRTVGQVPFVRGTLEDAAGRPVQVILSMPSGL